MTQNEFPFRDSAEDATNAAIHKSGKCFKAIAHQLWPGLKMDTAYARLKSCLDSDKRDKLSADEHIAIARFTEQFDFLMYCCNELDHAEPEIVNPEDKKAQLRRDFIAAAKLQAQLVKKLEALT